MATLSSSDARKNFADTVRRSQTEPVVIERRGRREAVMLAPEELDDIAAFDAAMSEEGENIPWDELKAELGWV